MLRQKTTIPTQKTTIPTRPIRGPSESDADSTLSPATVAEIHAYFRLRQSWYDDPCLYAEQRLGMNLTWQQRKILEAIQPEGAKVTVRSGHGIGKTGALAATILWHLETRDHCKIPCTAPTASQLRDVLWAEISKWMRRSVALSKKRGDHSLTYITALIQKSRDRLYERGSKAEWYAVIRTSGRNNPDALQGFHADDLEISKDGRSALETNKPQDSGKLLFVLEEASGIFEQVFEVAAGALSSKGARLIMLGNPVRNTGYFADSHKSRRGEFTALHFRSQDSPLVDPEYRASLIRKYGEGSSVVRVRADGEFPLQDDRALISLEWVEHAIYRQPYPQNVDEVRLGVDVAQYGSDRIAYVVRQGRTLLYAEIAAKQALTQTAGRAAQLRRHFGAVAVFVDSVGMGAGVVDMLKEQDVPTVAVDVRRTAPARQKNKMQARTLRDYLWLEMADWLREQEPSFLKLDREIANDLAAELSAPLYTLDSSGRIEIESKDDMRRRGLVSPDIADALGVTFYTPAPTYQPLNLPGL